MKNNRLILLLGSNLGNPEANIYQALSKLEEIFGIPIAVTNILKNQAVEFKSENIFCNIASAYSVRISPMKALKAVKNIEIEMGRLKDSRFGGYSDRLIDIDIVSFNDLKFTSNRLDLPHMKHFRERDFSRSLLNELSTLLP